MRRLALPHPVLGDVGVVVADVLHRMRRDDHALRRLRLQHLLAGESGGGFRIFPGMGALAPAAVRKLRGSSREPAESERPSLNLTRSPSIRPDGGYVSAGH